MADLQVANTILEQLGGRRFLAMTGSYNLIGSENALTMKLRRNSAGASHLRITLEPSDTYTMEFLRCRNMEAVPVRTLDDVYFDDLQRFFTDVTGLYTTLGTMRVNQHA